MWKRNLRNICFGVVNTVGIQQLLGACGIIYYHANQALSLPLECLKGDDVQATVSQQPAAFPQCAGFIFYLDCEFFRNRHNDSSSSGSRNNIGRNQFCLKPIRNHRNGQVGVSTACLSASLPCSVVSAKRDRSSKVANLI